MMRNVLLAGLVAVGLVSLLAGCNPVSVAQVTGDGARQVAQGHNYDNSLTDSKDERWSRLNLIRDIEDREFRDDLDLIFLLDRNSYLTQWHPGVKR